MSLDLATATVETFAPHVGTSFALRVAPERVLELVLHEASPLGKHTNAPRQPFALHFRSPGPMYVEQRIYALEHATLGTVEIFLVPLGPVGNEMQYEAVFG